MGRALVPFVVLGLLAATAAAGQHAAAEEAERIFDLGRGWLVSSAGQSPLPYAITFQGPLVALAPVVEMLGGSLDVGPLGQGHTLRVAEQEVLLGPDSAMLIHGEDVIQIQDTPRIGDGGLQVPVDVLERTYGDYLGYDFRWQNEERRLVVTRRPRRVLTVEVDTVNFQDVTTLVLQFAAAPRYRVEREGAFLFVDVLGDRLEPGARSHVGEDPLVRRVEIGEERVSIELAPEAAAAEPYVVRRDPWFQVVFDISRQSSAPAVRVSAATRSRTPSRRGDLKIVLDPGHGGAEVGAIGKKGSEEKDLTLVLARTLKRNLESRLPVRVVLTRTNDVDLPLETRTAIANQNQADLFVSLHLNSEMGTAARGAETFFLSMQASDARAASSAEFENRGSSAGSRGPDEDDFGLQLILWDLAQTHHLAQSQRLANLIQQELNEALGIRNRGVKQAPFRVLMGATMPAVLVELGFLSNPAEEAKLETASYRSQLVAALVRAVVRYRAQLLAATGSAGSLLP